MFWLLVFDKWGDVSLTVVGHGTPERPFQPSDSDVERSDPDPVLPSNDGSSSVECELESDHLSMSRSCHENMCLTSRKNGVSGSVSEGI